MLVWPICSPSALCQKELKCATRNGTIICIQRRVVQRGRENFKPRGVHAGVDSGLWTAASGGNALYTRPGIPSVGSRIIIISILGIQSETVHDGQGRADGITIPNANRHWRDSFTLGLGDLGFESKIMIIVLLRRKKVRGEIGEPKGKGATSRVDSERCSAISSIGGGNLSLIKYGAWNE